MLSLVPTDQTTRFSHRIVAGGSSFSVRNQDFGVVVGTYPSRARANVRARSLNVNMAEAVEALVASIGTPLGRWGGILATEDEWTGDDRKFEPEALRWDTEIPAGMPLRWTPTDNGGHNGAHHVGWIDKVARLEDGKIAGSGPYFDPAFGEFLKRAGKIGVSVDLDDETYDVTIPDEALDEQPQPGGTYPAIAEKKIFSDGRIRGATAVSIPAFATGFIEEAEPVEVTDDQDERVETVDPATGEALVAAGRTGGRSSRPKRKKSEEPKTGKRSGGTQGGAPDRDGDSDGIKDERENRGKKTDEGDDPEKKPKLTKQQREIRLVEAIIEALDDALSQLSDKQQEAIIANIKRMAEAFIAGAQKASQSGTNTGGKAGPKKPGSSDKTPEGETNKNDGKNTGKGPGKPEGRTAGVAGIVAAVENFLKSQAPNLAPETRKKLTAAISKLSNITASVGVQEFADEAPDEASSKITHSGLLLVAEDTGRWLLIQRAISDEEDPNAGLWEFPGGGLDNGEDPLAGAVREFAEEVGVPLPVGHVVRGRVDSGIYRLHIVTTVAESDIDIDGRTEVDPDNPDQDYTEAVAWWTPEHVMDGGSHIRPEVAKTNWELVTDALAEKALAASTEFIKDDSRGPGDGPDGQNGRHLPSGRRGPAKRNKTIRNRDDTPSHDQTGAEGCAPYYPGKPGPKGKCPTGRGPKKAKRKGPKKHAAQSWASTPPDMVEPPAVLPLPEVLTTEEWQVRARSLLEPAVEATEGVERRDYQEALIALDEGNNARAYDLASEHDLDLGPVPSDETSGVYAEFASDKFAEIFASRMPPQLILFWTKGRGGAEIGWGTPGDFDRCVRKIDDYTGKVYAKGTCANLHKIATGKWPNQNSAQTESFNTKKEGQEMPEAQDPEADDFMKALENLDKAVEGINGGENPEILELVAKARALLEDYVEYDEPKDAAPAEEAPAEVAAVVANGDMLEALAEADAPVEKVNADLAGPPPEVMKALESAREALKGVQGSEALPEGFDDAITEMVEKINSMAEPEKPVDEEMSLEPTENDSLVASSAPVAPPDEWFEPFALDGPTPLTITADGRVFGHLTTWASCHRGAEFQNAGVCVKPPSDPKAPFFHLGQVMTASGALVDVGTLTVGGGHADRRKGLVAALEHYDDVSTAGAAVKVHEDEFGVGLFGAVVADASPSLVAALRRAPLSGDWRKERGQWRLVAAHAVNTPGFPVPREMGLVASGGGADDVSFITTGRPVRQIAEEETFEIPAGLRSLAASVIYEDRDSMVASYRSEIDAFREDTRSSLVSQIKGN